MFVNHNKDVFVMWDTQKSQENRENLDVTKYLLIGHQKKMVVVVDKPIKMLIIIMDATHALQLFVFEKLSKSVNFFISFRFGR